MWKFYLKLGADALLVRSAGMLQQLLDLGGTGSTDPETGHVIPELHGDFSLNAANVISARGLLKEGLGRLVPTHDLDAQQVRSSCGHDMWSSCDYDNCVVDVVMGLQAACNTNKPASGTESFYILSICKEHYT